MNIYFRMVGCPLFMVWLFLLIPHPVFGSVLIDRIVAVVNHEVVTQSDLEAAQAETRFLPEGSDPSSEARPETEASLLKKAIERVLFRQTAQKAGVRITNAELERTLTEIERRNQFTDRAAFRQAVESSGITWERYLENLTAEWTLMKLIGQEVEPHLVVTRHEREDYYKRFPDQFQANKIKLQQILFRLPADVSGPDLEAISKKAEQVRSEIVQGSSFDEQVQLYSEGPEKARGGDLGYFQRGGLQPGLEAALFGLTAGEISPVMQTPAGLHIFKVTEKVEGVLVPLDAAEQVISRFLMQEKREVSIRQWLNKRLKETFIEIK
jgi:parvulin-like peptidyl-prolyl isomerase